MTSSTDIERAARAIRRGELVIFPTETVYGLGANALDAAAVKRIFEVKGRPSSSPLIVHIASIEAARELAAEWPDEAQRLAERFWPGPLTIVIAKRPIVPDIVTAGLGSVGLRMPANATALALIRESRVPIAAPSANRFTELSPTTAEHARQSLGDQVAIVLDDGPTTVGIESTVIGIDRSGLQLLRPGMITREQIEEVAGPLSATGESEGQAHRSPGQHARHYRPRTPLLIGSPPTHGTGAYLYIDNPAAAATPVAMPNNAQAYAARIFSVLHELDARGFDWIAVEPLPETREWEGIRDRLLRASS